MPRAPSSTSWRRPGCRPSRRRRTSSSTSSLDPPTALVWLRALTDLRLALGTRLGVEEGDEEYWYALPDEDPRAQAHHIFEWLAFLQETLVRTQA
ncbi:DUF2017 family protein [Nocardioides convexus]|uniref:DUF2017 family protein n=1 Tax=Nocardioides convexus TaxID=2712224 RepID=UPI0024187A84|nr:DUF2017 family protein [Nocardioides convexus]